MSGHNGPAPVADISVENVPENGQKIQDGYIEGSDPVSLGAPHSSLVRNTTWIGMGLMLASLAGMGTLIYGAGTYIWGHGASDNITNEVLIAGAVMTVVMVIGSIILITVGRKNYKAYRKETGRRN